MCVIMAGTPWDGFRFYGPFDSGTDAEQYQSKHLYHCDFWWIVPLEKRCDMRKSLTSRLVQAADGLRLLRSDVNRLAESILTDDNGISEVSYLRLCAVFDRLGGMPELNVDATDSRWYIPERSV